MFKTERLAIKTKRLKFLIKKKSNQNKYIKTIYNINLTNFIS